MESDFEHHPHNLFLNQQQQLTRFRSAPSSFFSSVLDREFCEDFLNRPSSPDTDRFIARLISGNDSTEENDAANRRSSQFVGSSMKTEPVVEVDNINSNNSSSNNNNSQSYFSTEPPPVPNQDANYGAVTTSSAATMALDQLPPMTNGRRNSNLVRQSSSPAGLFANIKVDQSASVLEQRVRLNKLMNMTAGFGSIKGMENFMGTNNAGTAYPNANTFSNQMNYPSRPASSLGQMNPIAESESRSIQDVGGFGEGHRNNYLASFPVGAWDDSDNHSGLKRIREDDDKGFSGLNGSEVQNEELKSRPPLAHHLSLPKTSSELSAIEKFLQLQDSVPCRIRAKRGCATHPRSIAERVRRTKISERMRKLQDLVPNMDKQTNTADMLDLAVDYIKDLQNQVKILSASRAKCTCSNRHQ